jgi:putative tryptophan/tyrosine transport system substrate-binding protein
LNRRRFIAVLGGTAVSPLSADAQPPKVATLGVLVVDTLGSEQFWRLFRDALRKLGYIEGRNVRFEFRSDHGNAARLPELAAELVRLKVDLIVTWFTPPALAAKQATREIPIVMALAGNPVENGLVESLARPGGNVTGIAAQGAELAGKSVELIRDMIPSTRRVAALANAPDPFSKPFIEKIRLAGAASGTTIGPVLINGTEELEAAFSAMEKERPDAIIVQPSLPAKLVAELALTYRIPAVSIVRAFVEEGGLMSYLAAEAEVYGRAAALVDKILRGARPADLPVEQATKFSLIINLKTAKALGLTVPPSMLQLADEAIE